MILFPGLDSRTNVWPRLLCVIVNLCLIFILIQECWQLTLEFTGELLFDGFFKKGWKLDITRGSLCIYIFKRHTSTGNKGLFPFNIRWRCQICFAKCLYSSSSHRDDLPENLGKNLKSLPKISEVYFQLIYRWKTSLPKLPTIISD